jgi:hypothetical protein
MNESELLATIRTLAATVEQVKGLAEDMKSLQAEQRSQGEKLDKLLLNRAYFIGYLVGAGLVGASAVKVIGCAFGG